MRPLLKDILAALWLGILIPGLVLNAAVLFDRQEPPAAAAETQPEELPTVLLQPPEGQARSLSLPDYLTGVVLGEMPASFHPEALKAQTVAAGTYVRKALQTGKHGGSVCGDPGCCQAWLAPEDYPGTPEDLEKVRTAVRAVWQYALVYEDALIEAVYFSCSGGQTEAAVAVWGADFPYLQSVESPGEEAARYHTDSILIPQAEFFRLLNLPVPEETDFFTDITHTEGGGVDSITIGGKTFTGTELRALLNLRSTAFTLETAGDHIRISTRGWGHRVGMSQYGANAMAQTGHTWQQILQHYYPGTNVVPFEELGVRNEELKAFPSGEGGSPQG